MIVNRQEFIRELRRSMTGQFDTSEIEETVNYYEDYIDLQIRKGKAEERLVGDSSGGYHGAAVYPLLFPFPAARMLFVKSLGSPSSLITSSSALPFQIGRAHV